MPVLAHVLGTQQRGAQQTEHRAGVAAAVGLQRGQGVQLLQRHGGGVGDGHVHVQHGHRGLAAPEAAGVVVHPLAEGGDVRLVNGKAGRQLVAAEAQQQILAVFQRRKEVEAAPAAAGALAGGAVEVDHKAGTGIFFGEAAGHDAHHALMPAAALQHQRTPLPFGHMGDHLLRLGVDGLLYILPLPVQGAQLPRHAVRLLRVGAEQEIRRLVGGAHAACRVDAGRQHKADLDGGDLPAGKTRLLQKRL